MSKGMLFIGLIVSTMVHLWALGLDQFVSSDMASDQAGKTVTMVDVVAVKDRMPDQQTQAVNPPETQIKESPSEPQEQSVSEPLKKTPPEPKPEVQPVAQPAVPADQAQRYANVDKSGSFAGSSTGRQQPLLRIDWGSEAQATDVVQKAQMRFAVLDAKHKMVAELIQDEQGQWHRQVGLTATMTTYSSSLRIVDRVPAFKSFCSAFLQGTERLAVMVPSKIERNIETAKISAAAQRGLSMTQIEIFGGAFAITGEAVAFRIDKLVERIGS